MPSSLYSQGSKPNKEEIILHLSKWQQEEEGSLFEYCRLHGLHYNYLRRWKYRLGLSTRTRSPVNHTFTLAPMESAQIKSSQNIRAAIEVVFPNGTQLSFYKEVSAEYLQTLLSDF